MKPYRGKTQYFVVYVQARVEDVLKHDNNLYYIDKLIGCFICEERQRY